MFDSPLDFSSSRVSNVADSGNERAAALIAYWHGHSRPPLLPKRRAFDPVKLMPWIGFISIFECLDGGRDFLVRLDGSEIVSMTGEDWTGRLLSDIDAQHGSNAAEALRSVVECREPRLQRMEVLQKKWVTATRVCLPVSVSDGQHVDQVFTGLFLDQPAP